MSFSQLADTGGVTRHTAENHYAKVIKQLKTEEYQAWAAIEQSLNIAGLVGEP